MKRDREVVESRGFCTQGPMARLEDLFVRTVRVEVDVGNVLKHGEIRACDMVVASMIDT